MRANVFEGARRLLVVIQVLWVLCVVGIAWGMANSEYVRINVDVTPDKRGGFLRPEGAPECDAEGADAGDSELRTTQRGANVHVYLCLRNLRTLLESSDASAINAYASKYGDRFQLAPEMESRAESLRVRKRIETAGYAVAVAVGGWFVLWLLGSVVGWVARGFVAPSR